MTWDDTKSRVEENDNVATFMMEELREAHGAGKLGVHVREQISKTLAGMRLGHVPVELPSFQHEQVRLFKQGTPVGDIIRIVLTPGEQNDRALVEQFGDDSPDYAAILEKVRELVSE